MNNGKFIKYINAYVNDNKFIKAPSLAKMYLDEYIKEKNEFINEIEYEKRLLNLITIARFYVKELFQQDVLCIYRNGCPRIYMKKRLNNEKNTNEN